MLAHPVSWSDRRQELIHRRLTAISPGLATLFRDGCRLINATTGLEAVPHFVAHACREIESGLRDVLRGVAGLDKPSGAAGHRADIVAILGSLGIAEDDPVAVLWLDLPGSDSALHAMAHRRGLSVRTGTSDLADAWDMFQAILALVLDRAEATAIRAFEVVDALVATPSEDSLAKLRGSMPQNQVTLGYFFERAGPEWIDLLRDTEYLRPDESPDEEGRYAPWAAGRWVVRAAAADERFGLEIAQRLRVTRSPAAAVVGIEILASLPPEAAAGMADDAARWVSIGGDAGRDRAVDLTLRLQGGTMLEAALTVTRAILDTGPIA